MFAIIRKQEKLTGRQADQIKFADDLEQRRTAGINSTNILRAALDNILLPKRYK
jgi:hypothetical protein